MTTMMDRSPSAPGYSASKKALIERLNMWTGFALGIIMAVVFYYLSKALLPANTEESFIKTNQDQYVLLSMIGWLIGFMTGIGALIAPFRWVMGRDLSHDENLFYAGKDQGIKRYFRFTTDHKVVGIQYLVITMVIFGVGGILAMLIRTNLGHAGGGWLHPQAYNAVVGYHGIIMIVGTIIMVTGPFGNFIMPIMIGARDMAFPRLNALSFWLVVAAIPPLLASFFLGGISTGWSAYNPLASQAPHGMDGYIMFIVIFALSTMVAGANITTTVVKMRAKGMTWNRTPIFVYGVVASVALALPAFPVFFLSQVMSAMDRAMGSTFFDPRGGGSGWLYENLFWIMGHPEVYVILIPAVAALMEMAPVFTRRPLFSFNVAVLGIAGISGLSILVWAHHMYTTGWAPLLNGPFMLTTELISIPTGMLFFVLIGTLWRGRLWMTMPTASIYALLWNFMIGGITGIYLSDVPIDAFLHGSMYVTAHFHYTLMGAGLTGALAALVYWFPKMTGRMFDKSLSWISFWLVQIGFNVTFIGMFLVGLAGQPRRVEAYPAAFSQGNLITTMGAYTIMAGMLVLLYGVISSWRSGALAPANPWFAKTLEWSVPNPVPLENFAVLPVVTSDPYGYGKAKS
ncbi:MAG TPA: cbb3-type cytochrome c oxidase subunit I [Candidatus Paceibacterota bacterium]|nr:cbb3-type cytochrome c oxidase subunit I [Candidatus Paceibacterota bacterium]